MTKQPPSAATAIGALALAPLVSIAMLSAPYLFASAGAIPVLVLFYIAPVAYATAAVFVLPILLVWRAARRPGYVIGALWGALSACGAIVFIASQAPSGWWSIARQGWFLMAPPGAMSGLLYAWLIERWSTENRE